MKTVIALADDLFQRAEAAARRLRVSRSELYAKAIAEFLKQLRGRAITERLNDVYSRRRAKLDSGLHRAQLKLSKKTLGRAGRNSARGDLVGRPARASTLRTRIQAAGTGGAGRCVQSQPDSDRHRSRSTSVELAEAPGNVLLPARSAGLSRDSVVNVSQLLTLDRSFLAEHAGTLPPRLQRSVDEGLRTVLRH